MREIDFRMAALKHNKEKYDGKKIALYGIKDSAERILSELSDQNIIALLDEKSVGKYVFGKLVISLEEAILADIEVIIIAAEIKSSVFVSKRILQFCLQNNILLLNMYGVEEKAIEEEHLLQNIQYSNLTADSLHQCIERYDVIYVQLNDVLGNVGYYDELSLLRAFEKKTNADCFLENRLEAKRKNPRTVVYSIQNIYQIYETLVYPNGSSVMELCEREERFWIDSLIPHTKMIDIINNAVKMGKKIYVLSDMKISLNYVGEIYEKLGLHKECKIIQENICGYAFTNGAIRKCVGADFEKKALYIGTGEGYLSRLALSYGMELFLVKGPIQLLEIVSDAEFKMEELSDEEKSRFVRVLYQQVKLPFLDDCTEEIQQVISEIQFKEKEEVRINKLLLHDVMESLEITPLSFRYYEKPKVSIIIPAYNQFGYTYNCLKSILKNTVNVEYEVILADDCSTDETSHIEDYATGVKHVRNEENLLFLKNCNNASKYAKGEYILFLNNDTQVLFNWLAPMVHLMESDSAIGMTGSKLIYPNGMLQEAGGIIWSDGSGENFGRGQNPELPEFNYVKEVDYISGASIMIRTSLWKEIGGFDEHFAPAYYEDTDLAFEVRKHGKKVVFQPASKVVHFEGISNGTETSGGIKKYQVVNKEKFEEKWHSVLVKENRTHEGRFSARDRKCNRKTILFISRIIPTPDCDAGSVSVFSYLSLFVKKGYLVKFVPLDFINRPKYSFVLEQMGIEVLYGENYKKTFRSWLLKNKQEIDFAFVNYPMCGEAFMDLLKCAGIKIRYYGHDLHYLRKRREYELYGKKEDLEESEKNYALEGELIRMADTVYYPSCVEEEIVKKEFGKKCAKAIPLYVYSKVAQVTTYCPEKRKGIMFIGGYNHKPNVDAVLWFAKEIYPNISPNGEIPFYIVGSNEPMEVQSLNAPGIIHKGYVTDEELDELYETVKLVIVPLRYGAGVKGKIIDTMYRGVPLVSTSIGVEGIQEADQYIATADDAVMFGEKVVELYYNGEKLIETSKSYASVIGKYFSEEAAWNIIGEDF